MGQASFHIPAGWDGMLYAFDADRYCHMPTTEEDKADPTPATEGGRNLNLPR